MEEIEMEFIFDLLLSFEGIEGEYYSLQYNVEIKNVMAFLAVFEENAAHIVADLVNNAGNEMKACPGIHNVTIMCEEIDLHKDITEEVLNILICNQEGF